MKSAQIVANKVTKQFGKGTARLEVLKGITAQFRQGKTYAITGVSGTGKSTLLHILAGIDEPSSGHVLYNGTSISKFSAAERATFFNAAIGLVFQQPYLIRELSVLENVMLKSLIKGSSGAECEERALQLLNKTGLKNKAYSRPSALSGGQQQRVAIIRALFNNPAFLLADEPTGNLDIQTGKDIVDFLIDCQAEWNMGIIVSSHDTYVAQKMDVVYKLEKGLLVQE